MRLLVYYIADFIGENAFLGYPFALFIIDFLA